MPHLTHDEAKARAQEIDQFDQAAVRLHSGRIVDSLKHRSYLVRMAAAEALGRAGIECDQLATAMAVERNDLVLASLCGAVADAGCTSALAQLEEIASRHPSSLARSSAVVAISDLRETDAVDFFRARIKKDSSPRVRATLVALLVQAGYRDALKAFRQCLRSKDYIVRIRLANLLEGGRTGPFREEVLALFREALQVETSLPAREAFERALATS